MQQGDGDGDALAHAAGELVRIGVQPLLGGGDADPPERLRRAVAGRLRRDVLVRLDRLDHLGVDAQHRVQRRHRILEDHRDALAAQLAQLRLGQADEFAALEADGAARDAAGLVDEAEHGEPADGLAGAGFSHQPQHLAAIDREADAIDGADEALAGGEGDREVLDVEDRSRHLLSLGFSTSRSRSPTRLMATMATTSAIPG